MWVGFKSLAASSLAVAAACSGAAEHPRTCGKPDFVLSSKNLIASDSSVCSFQPAGRPSSSDNDDWKFSLRARERIAQSGRPTDTDASQVADRGATRGPSDRVNSKPHGAGADTDDAGSRAETGTKDPAEDTAVDAGGVGSVGSGPTSDSAPNDNVASKDSNAAGGSDDRNAAGEATDEASQTPGGEGSGPNTDASSDDSEPIGSGGGNGGTKGGGGSVSNNGNGNGSEGASPGKGKGANDDEV